MPRKYSKRYSNLSTVERFLNKVNKTDTCWNWTACVRSRYGGFIYNGKMSKANRVSYELFVGPIPDNLLVCHTCDNKLCVNPQHLFLGTFLDNNLDKIKKGRDNPPKSENHWNVKLTKNDVKLIRKTYNETNLTQKQLARQFGVDASNISRIVNNKSRREG